MTENLEMNDDFGQLDNTENKWPLFFPPGIWQSRL